MAERVSMIELNEPMMLLLMVVDLDPLLAGHDLSLLPIQLFFFLSLYEDVYIGQECSYGCSSLLFFASPLCFMKAFRFYLLGLIL